MNKEWKNFCPLWLYKIVVSITVYDYVVRDIGIFVTQKKYTNFFAEMYDDLNQESIEQGVNLFLQFLGELKSKDPFMFLNHYMYHIITDINPNEKGIFKKDAYKANSRIEIDPEKALKDFKVFTFSCRSGLTKKAPVGWDITNESELGLLNDVINKTFSIDDMIDSVS